MDLRQHARRRVEQEQWTQQPWSAEIETSAAIRDPVRGQRRHKNERPDAFGPPRRVFGGNRPAVGHANQDRLLESGAIECLVNLCEVVLDAAARFEVEAAGWLVAQ